MASKKRSHVALLLAIALIGGATLFPAPANLPISVGLCLICGGRGVADAILNILLFSPLGAAMGAARTARLRALLLAITISAAVETAQLVVPGRDPSLGDVIFNSLGAVLGYASTGVGRGWLAPHPVTAKRLEAAAAATVVAVVVVTSYLLQPSFPTAAYYGQWAPRFTHMEHYLGQVHDAQLDTLPLPAGVLRDPAAVRRGLLEGGRVSVRVSAGPPPPGLAPIFSIAAHWGIEVLLLGQDRDALVLRYRPRAADFRLDFSDLRVPAPTHRLQEGRLVTISAQRQRRGWCVAVDEWESCAMGFTAGRGWSLLLYLERLPAPLKRMLDGLWLAVVLFPLGLWARPDRVTGLALAAVLATLAIIPPALGLLPTPPTQFLAGAAGVGLGMLAGRRLGPERATSIR